jgi:predicted acetyltransferase
MRYDCLIHDQLLHTEDIKGAVVSLKLQGFYHGSNEEELPSYSYLIMLGNLRIGTIALRLGFNDMTMIHGHIGYTIDEGYRGHGYSYYALQLIIQLARLHGYQHLLVTCDPNNLSSIKSVLKAGGNLIEENRAVPKDHIYYVLGITKLNCYEIPL